ncbi:MAG: glycosyl transferase [Candidatus Sumerlaeia bacterium]
MPKDSPVKSKKTTSAAAGTDGSPRAGLRIGPTSIPFNHDSPNGRRSKTSAPYTKYGRFSKDRQEFIITRPDTPAPWVNYISNGTMTGLVSHTGGGFSFYITPKDHRITRWRYNALPLDRPGRCFILRDRATGRFWSPTWQPCGSPVGDFECRHAMFRTTISSITHGIRTAITYFVPLEDNLEVWLVRVKNEGRRARSLDVFAFQELCLGHALVDLINQPNDQHFSDVRFRRDSQLLVATRRYWVTYGKATVEQPNKAWDRWVWFASSLPVAGFDGHRNTFIGRWRSESSPLAVERGACFNTEITAGDPIAALQCPLDLRPGEEKTFVVLLGIVEKREHDDESFADAARIADKYRCADTALAELERLRTAWRDYLECAQVQTPDDDMNTMLNVWNQYQTAVTFLNGRDAGYYHGGLLFGRGFRDSCQDIMGPVMARPDWVRRRLLEMGAHQFRDGSTYHCYYPVTGGGERTGHSDTPLWLLLAATVYLKETGDWGVLKEVVPFADEGRAPLVEHVFAAVDYTLTRLSPRGLALFGPGDWNDTLDYMGRRGRGESVWVSMFLCYVLKELIGLCERLGEGRKAAEYRDAWKRVADAINEHCWDGAWYVRGTNDLGEVIGSARCGEGRIFLNTQSWAVISGVARGQRAVQCMDSVREHLETPKGPKILHPAYTVVNPNIGLATRCVPGKKENGAVFNHPVSWAVLAECVLGRGERAFEIYRKALPMNPVVGIDRYEVEPYVYAEYVTSPDHPTFGQASHSWLTGSSTWMLRGALDWILGVRPDYDGLIIDPCIPPAWREYKVRRRFRGKRYAVTVKNPGGVGCGVDRILVLGHEWEGNLLALDRLQAMDEFSDRDEISVEVTLGGTCRADRNLP